MGTRHLYWILTGPSFSVCSYLSSEYLSGNTLSVIPLLFCASPPNPWLALFLKERKKERKKDHLFSQQST
jgi:hypothetical protein